MGRGKRCKNRQNYPLPFMKISTFTRSAIAASAAWIASVPYALALNFGNTAANLGGNDIRSTVESVLSTVLSYLALAAVVVIVIAGIRLVVSSGDEGAVDKAKKTILFAVIGLIIILLANAIVSIVANLATS